MCFSLSFTHPHTYRTHAISAATHTTPPPHTHHAPTYTRPARTHATSPLHAHTTHTHITHTVHTHHTPPHTHPAPTRATSPPHTHTSRTHTIHKHTHHTPTTHTHTHCTLHPHTHHIYMAIPAPHTHTHSLSSFILRILTEHLLCARHGARCWGCSMPSPALVVPTVQRGCSGEAPCLDKEYLSRGRPTSPASFLSSFPSCPKRRQNYGGENFQGIQGRAKAWRSGAPT